MQVFPGKYVDLPHSETAVRSFLPVFHRRGLTKRSWECIISKMQKPAAALRRTNGKGECNGDSSAVRMEENFTR